jgi:hypothetical protein
MIPAFASLYRWTWFYWRQNRFGMLTALLAMPIHHPLLNLLFQNWLVSFCGLMVFPLAHAYLLGWRTAPLSGVAAAIVFLLSGPDCFHMDYLLANQPYAVSGCLGLLGLMALGSESTSAFRVALRWTVAAFLLFLAFWVSLPGMFLVAPLLLLQSFIGSASRRGKHLLPGLLIIILAAFPNSVVTLRYPYQDGRDYGWSLPYSWPHNCALLLRNVFHVTPPAFLISVLCLAAIGLVGWRLCSHRVRRRAVLCACLTGVLVAMFYFVVAAASYHVRNSGFPYRYAIPSIILLVISAAMSASLAAERLPARWRGGLAAAFLLALIGGVTLRYGLASYGRVRMIFDQRFGGSTSALCDNHCTHVLGNYEDVWETVFHANLTNYESGSRQVIWGITMRSQVTRDLWFPALNGGRIAVVRTANSDKDWQIEAKKNQLPELKLVGESPRIRIFVPMW